MLKSLLNQNKIWLYFVLVLIVSVTVLWNFVLEENRWTKILFRSTKCDQENASASWTSLPQTNRTRNGTADVVTYFPNDFNGANCGINTRRADVVQKKVEEAKKLLEPSTTPIEKRLAIMILYSPGFSGHDRFLPCALRKIQKNLMQTTPTDIFIWVTPDKKKRPKWLDPQQFPRTYIMTISEDTWKVPCGLRHDSQWAARNMFWPTYYLMGRWRLSFALDFTKAMGYEYYLQVDDDTCINHPIPINLVSIFQEKNYQYGTGPTHFGEPIFVTNGLPEFTKYWLQLQNYTPIGTIQNHIQGQDLKQFSTQTWDHDTYPGYFIMIRISFWYSEIVQNYLTHIFRSGQDIEARWQEQAVMNMIRLIFVPEQQVYVMKDFNITHGRDHTSLCKDCLH